MQQLTFSQRNPMQFRHPQSYRILSDGRILQDPMGSGVGYVDLGNCLTHYFQNIKLTKHKPTLDLMLNKRTFGNCL